MVDDKHKTFDQDALVKQILLCQQAAQVVPGPHSVLQTERLLARLLSRRERSLDELRDEAGGEEDLAAARFVQGVVFEIELLEVGLTLENDV